MAPLRIGILQVNHDKSEDIGDRFPDDSHRFRDLFDELDTRFRYRVYMTIGGELPESPDEQDGFLITGSPLSALDDSLPWLAGLMDFIRECDRAKVPMIGACFGHQAIARALGGRLVKREGGYNIGVEPHEFVEVPPGLDRRPEMPAFHMFHEDEVAALPPGCRLMAR
ncbi:MAG: type 1 glutamine amidotransferase, partial [Pseudomonadota bacterium]|nr:type 1 glutamine amidotransferase [Pseudomonadota bacterium]